MTINSLSKFLYLSSKQLSATSLNMVIYFKTEIGLRKGHLFYHLIKNKLKNYSLSKEYIKILL
jgi:hypothetical protein